MNYNTSDLDVFLQQKEFIDTAVVPLLPIDFSAEKGKQYASAALYITSLVNYVEKQFKGRIFVTPSFSYFHNIELKGIYENLVTAGFKHVLFVTTDQIYAKKTEDYDILWLPAIPLESMDIEVVMRILQDQLQFVIPKLTEVWNGVTQ